MKKFLLRLVLYLAFVFASLFLILMLQILPRMERIVTTVASNRITAAVADAIETSVEARGVRYDELIHLDFSETGDVRAMSVDTVHLNAVRTALLREVLATFGNEYVLTFSLPLLSGIPGGERISRVPISVYLYDAVRCDILSDFREAGINQTIHRVSLSVTVVCRAILPFRRVTFTVPAECAIGETVIVGNVPEAYTKINRLTDSFDEQDIDDIYDFGAQVP